MKSIMNEFLDLWFCDDAHTTVLEILGDDLLDSFVDFRQGLRMSHVLMPVRDALEEAILDIED